MGTLNMAVTGLSTANPVPGTYIEVKFAQGELLGNGLTPKVLFIGPKTSSGSATTGTQAYPIGSESDAITYFGAGSPVHRMFRRFSQVCKSALVYGIAPAESAGDKAADTVTFATQATGSGTVTYTLAGETVTVGVANGDSVTTIAAALKAQINMQTHWPVTADNSSGVLTVTAKVKGTNGNLIRHRCSITSGIGTTVTLGSSSTNLLLLGATNEVYTTALAAILPDKYDYIVPGVNPAVDATTESNLVLVRNQVVSQALPITGVRQQMIVAHVGTLSNAPTFAGTAMGHPRVQCVWQESSEWEPMELAAHFAGVRYNLETGADPGVNYDFYGLGANDIWGVPKQYSNADYPTSTELSTAISGGLTPIAVSSSGNTYLVRSCTTYASDVRVRDTSKVTVADRFAADLSARYQSHWSRAKVQDDPTDPNVQVPANVATPKKVKACTIAPLYTQYANEGLLDSVKTFAATTGDLATCSVGIDPVMPTRINAMCPIHVTPLLHQFAAIVSENSSA